MERMFAGKLIEPSNIHQTRSLITIGNPASNRLPLFGHFGKIRRSDKGRMMALLEIRISSNALAISRCRQRQSLDRGRRILHPASALPAAAKPPCCACWRVSRCRMAAKSCLTARMSPMCPGKRPVHTVFQSYALFPAHDRGRQYRLPVEDGEKDLAQIKARVAELLEDVRLSQFGSRFPHELSVGNASGLPLPAHWPTARDCCCSTSRCRHWMQNCANRCRSS